MKYQGTAYEWGFLKFQARHGRSDEAKAEARARLKALGAL